MCYISLSTDSGPGPGPYRRYDRLPPIQAQFSIESDSDMTESSGLIQEYDVFDPLKPRPHIIFIIGEGFWVTFQGKTLYNLYNFCATAYYSSQSNLIKSNYISNNIYRYIIDQFHFLHYFIVAFSSVVIFSPKVVQAVERALRRLRSQLIMTLSVCLSGRF